MRRFGIIWGLLCLSALWAGGCSEAQRETVDRWAPAAQQAGETVGGFAQSESGQTLLGPEASFWASVGGLGLAAIAATWQTVRRSRAVEALTAVVKAVDRAEPGVKDAVKAAVLLNADGSALIEKVKHA